MPASSRKTGKDISSDEMITYAKKHRRGEAA